LDVRSNATIGHSSFVSLYTLEGIWMKSVSLPLKCARLSCNTGSTFVTIEGSTLVVKSSVDDSSFYQFVSIDLSTFTIINQLRGPSNWFPTGFIPESPETALIVVKETFLSTLDIKTLSASTPLATNLDGIIAEDSFLLSQGVLCVCGVQKYTHNYTFNTMEHPYTRAVDKEQFCGEFTAYVPAQNQIISSNHSSYRDTVFQFIRIDGSKFIKSPGSLVVSEEAYPVSFTASSDYAFPAVRRWEHQDISDIYQIKTSPGGGIVIDSLVVPDHYIVYYGISQVLESKNVYFVATSGYYEEDPPGLLILTFNDESSR